MRAAAQLEGPPYSEALEYLLDWADKLVGRSGAGMDGAVPLTYSTLRDFCWAERVRIEPYEADALMALDAALRNQRTGAATGETPAQGA